MAEISRTIDKEAKLALLLDEGPAVPRSFVRNALSDRWDVEGRMN